MSSPRPYPRHFGVTFRGKAEFMSLIELLEKHPQFIVTSLSHRFEGRPDEHAYIFLSVPSNNVIEFKWYNDRRMIY